jgi:hypothetical protein
MKAGDEMKAIKITKAELDEFKRLQEKERWDWPAIFSANGDGDVWPRVTNGRHSSAQRVLVNGKSKVLELVVKIYTELREEGGRIFINWNGAFNCREGEREKQQFILWDLGKDALPVVKPLTGEAARLEYKRLRDRQSLLSNSRSRK